MKFKASKYLPTFFLVSFFISFCLNIGISANAYSSQFTNSHPKDRLHLNEKVFSSSIEEIIFEENENENELEFDLALNLIPYFLDFSNLEKKANSFARLQNPILKPTNPIYIEVCNFRI